MVSLIQKRIFITLAIIFVISCEVYAGNGGNQY